MESPSAGHISSKNVGTNMKEHKHSGNKSKTKPHKSVTIRFTIKLDESNEVKCPEVNYFQLYKKEITLKNQGNNIDNSLPDDWFMDPFDSKGRQMEEERISAMVRNLESKYGGNKNKKGKKFRTKILDLMDLGMGYDESDSFIDNSEAYDELVPSTLTTKLGGFYINSGVLEFKEVKSSSEDEGDIGGIDLETMPFQSAVQKQPQPSNDIKQYIAKDLEIDETISHSIKKVKQGSNAKTEMPIKEISSKKINGVKSNEVKTHDKTDIHNSLHDKSKSSLATKLSKKLIKKSASLNLSKTVCNNVKTANSMDYYLELSPQLKHNVDQVIQMSLVFKSVGGDNNLPLTGKTGNSSDNNIEKGKQLNFTVPSPFTLTQFFTPKLNASLYAIEDDLRKNLNGPQRSKVYDILEVYVPCSRDTLIKRAKRLWLDNKEKSLILAIVSFKDAISSDPGKSLSSNQSALQHLRDIVHLKLDIWDRQRHSSPSNLNGDKKISYYDPNAYINNFLETELKTNISSVDYEYLKDFIKPMVDTFKAAFVTGKKKKLTFKPDQVNPSIDYPSLMKSEGSIDLAKSSLVVVPITKNLISVPNFKNVPSSLYSPVSTILIAATSHNSTIMSKSNVVSETITVSSLILSESLSAPCNAPPNRIQSTQNNASTLVTSTGACPITPPQNRVSTSSFIDFKPTNNFKNFIKRKLEGDKLIKNLHPSNLGTSRETIFPLAKKIDHKKTPQIFKNPQGYTTTQETSLHSSHHRTTQFNPTINTPTSPTNLATFNLIGPIKLPQWADSNFLASIANSKNIISKPTTALSISVPASTTNYKEVFRLKASHVKTTKKHEIHGQNHNQVNLPVSTRFAPPSSNTGVKYSTETLPAIPTSNIHPLPQYLLDQFARDYNFLVHKERNQSAANAHLPNLPPFLSFPLPPPLFNDPQVLASVCSLPIFNPPNFTPQHIIQNFTTPQNATVSFQRHSSPKKQPAIQKMPQQQNDKTGATNSNPNQPPSFGNNSKVITLDD